MFGAFVYTPGERISAMNPMDFVRAQPPFDALPGAALEWAAKGLEIGFYPKASRILVQGGDKSNHLYLIRKGEAHLALDGQAVAHLEEGDYFGYPSLLSGEPPAFDAIAEQDLLVYRWPQSIFKGLLEHPEFAGFFTRNLVQRLRQIQHKPIATGGVELNRKVSDLITRPPVYVAASATVGEAAQVMQSNNISSVLVSGQPLGILTDRDLRNRVLAAGLGPETPVKQAMSTPIQTLHASSPLYEALLFMVRQGIHHLPLEQNGQIVGMVSDTDFLQQQTQSPLFLGKKLGQFKSPSDLNGYTSEVGSVVRNLLAGGLGSGEIGRTVAAINDQLLQTLLNMAEEQLGPPPSAYAWLVFGSEGRMEQSLPTDQDNALVFEGETPEDFGYFAKLAQFVVEALIQAGFPVCPGGYMATHWHKPLGQWVAQFMHWVKTPTPRELLEAQIFFDFRKVGGRLSLASLEQVVQKAPGSQVFLAQLAKASLQFRPPLGFFRQIREDHGGVDIKKGGIAPIVSLARLYSLQTGSLPPGTLERLIAAAPTLGEERAETLQEAFRFMQDLRLRHQLEQQASGQTPDNTLRLERLSALERRHLKEAFAVVREQQEALSQRFQTERLG